MNWMQIHAGKMVLFYTVIVTHFYLAGLHFCLDLYYGIIFLFKIYPEGLLLLPLEL